MNRTKSIAIAIGKAMPVKFRYAVVERLGWRTPAENPETHPERLAVLPYLTGRCIEVGCGHRKTIPEAVGVDLVPGGRLGAVGNVKGQISVADVAANGGCLPFRNEAFDSLIARHNLEHYVDTLATLEEWHRVLTPGGRVIAIVPDEERYPGRTLDLDPTHFHGFTQSSLGRLMMAAHLTPLETSVVVPEWSFLIVAEKR